MGVSGQWSLTARMRSLPTDGKSQAGVHKKTYSLPETTTFDIVVVNKYGGGHKLIINFLFNYMAFQHQWTGLHLS